MNTRLLAHIAEVRYRAEADWIVVQESVVRSGDIVRYRQDLGDELNALEKAGWISDIEIMPGGMRSFRLRMEMAAARRCLPTDPRPDDLGKSVIQYVYQWWIERGQGPTEARVSSKSPAFREELHSLCEPTRRLLQANDSIVRIQPRAIYYVVNGDEIIGILDNAIKNLRGLYHKDPDRRTFPIDSILVTCDVLPERRPLIIDLLRATRYVGSAAPVEGGGWELGASDAIGDYGAKEYLWYEPGLAISGEFGSAETSEALGASSHDRAPHSQLPTELKLLDDTAIESVDQDLLGFAPLAAAIVDSVNASRGPLVIHVDGAWGSGKSSFCRLARAMLRERGKVGGRQLVWADFIATQYEETNQADTALMLIIAAVLSRVSREDASPDWIRAKEQVRALLPPDPAGGDILDRIGVVGRFEETLGETLRKTNRGLILCIDDLDRCSLQFATQVFEAIRKYVATPNLYFVVAADYAVILQAIDGHIKNAIGPRVSAERALEKYIRTRLVLPRLDGAPADLPERLTGGWPVEQWRMLGLRDAVEADVVRVVFEELGNALTLRTYKKLINDLCLRFWQLAREGSASERLDVALIEDTKWRIVFGSAVEHLIPELKNNMDSDFKDKLIRRLSSFATIDVSAWSSAQLTSFITDGVLGEGASVEYRVIAALHRLASRAVRSGMLLGSPHEIDGQSGYQPGKYRYIAKVVDDKAARERIIETSDTNNEISGKASGEISTMRENGHSDNIGLALQALETKLEMYDKGSRIAWETMSGAITIIESNFSETSAIQVGNIAVTAEQLGFADIAWRLHSLQRDAGRFDGDFRLARQYISYLIDFDGKRLPSEDPIAGSGEPLVVATSWLRKFNATAFDQESFARYTLLKFQLDKKLGVLDEDALDIAMKELEERFISAPVLETLVILLQMTGMRKDGGGDVPLRLYEQFVRVHGEKHPLWDTLARSAADALASHGGNKAAREFAVKRYGDLKERGSRLWNAQTMHNMATILFADERDMAQAEGLWREAYRQKPNDIAIRRSFAQLLKSIGKTGDALKVLAGEKLE